MSVATPVALRLGLLLAAAAVASASAAGSDIFVSPSGSDASGDGSQAKPFATLPKAQLAARKALADTVGDDVTVHLGAGKYYQSEPLVLTRWSAAATSSLQWTYTRRRRRALAGSGAGGSMPSRGGCVAAGCSED